MSDDRVNKTADQIAKIVFDQCRIYATHVPDDFTVAIKHAEGQKKTDMKAFLLAQKVQSKVDDHIYTLIHQKDAR